jgi:hypothetical protein
MKFETCPICKRFEGVVREVKAKGICEERYYLSRERFGLNKKIETSGLYFEPVGKWHCMTCNRIIEEVK